MMKLLKKIRRKKNILKVVIQYRLKGYSYYISKRWGRRVHYDLISNNGKTRSEKRWAHKKGFLSSSIDRYGLNENNWQTYISDFEYMFISPINNAYEKWITDRLTPHYILQPFSNLLPELYYNIILRDGEVKIINLQNSKVETLECFFETLKKKKMLQMIPSQASKFYKTYLLEYIDGTFFINGEIIAQNDIVEFINNIKNYYIVREYSETRNDIRKLFNDKEPVFKFIVQNDEFNNTNIMSTVVQTERPYLFGLETDRRFSEFENHEIKIDLHTGEFFNDNYDEIYQGKVIDWSKICEQIKFVAAFMSEIEYMALFAKFTSEGLKLVDYSRKPDRPENMEDDSPLNIYLKKKAITKIKKLKNKEINIKTPFKWRALKILKRKYFRKGFREYMLAVWLNTVKDDFFNTKASIRKKLWAWRRGFPSYRIEQYGLNKSNYRDILSDYDYAWLNRINNGYQKWINDKTTMRYVLESVKQYIPDYYYYIGKRNNSIHIKGLQELPYGKESSVDGVIALLKEKKKLVFKPNAGTHGDGFYKLEFFEDKFFINNKCVEEQDVIEILCNQKSTYVVTEYLEMHSYLKNIYPNSVNTIRIMVLNRNCDDPKIVQSYMRVGTSNTGVTDNIAYGGIAVYVDQDTGYCYKAGLLIDHKYHDVDRHPDTGELLEGYLPNWDIVKKGIIDIARCIPQIEYMGYDIAITEIGFKILEINIHQDIHKAHEFTAEINDFFRTKKDLKKKQYYK